MMLHSLCFLCFFQPYPLRVQEDAISVNLANVEITRELGTYGQVLVTYEVRDDATSQAKLSL